MLDIVVLLVYCHVGGFMGGVWTGYVHGLVPGVGVDVASPRTGSDHGLM